MSATSLKNIYSCSISKPLKIDTELRTKEDGIKALTLNAGDFPIFSESPVKHFFDYFEENARVLGY